MSAASALGQGIQAMVAALRAMSVDPADQVRLLVQASNFQPAAATGSGVIGAAQASAQAAVGAFCRRAALIALARASAACRPASYDEAVDLRDLVCGLLDAEVTVASDAGDDASAQALRTLKTAVANDLTTRAANLTRLQEVSVGAPLPALVMAYRLYEDITRSDEISAYADARDPNFLPPQFMARGS